MIQWWQILLLTLYSAYQICDELTIVSSAGSPVFAGFITGLVMGDLKTGLFIGASLQLTVLGVGTFGGASRIDATSGAVLATAFSVAKGIDPEIAIATIAVPVATLLTYFDILGRMTTTYFAHRVDAAIERYDYKGIERNLPSWCCSLGSFSCPSSLLGSCLWWFFRRNCCYRSC